MKNLHVAALATLFGISAASGIALTQAQHPGNNSGLLAATASIASADQDDRGNGRGNRNNNNNGNWQNGQCNNGNVNGTRRGNGDADDNNQGNQGNQGNRGAGHGKKRGWQNSNNPHNCGTNGNNCSNGQYNNNGQYSGQYGQYGQQNGQYNCGANGGGYGQQGNTTLRGTITSVNGNQITLMAGFGNVVTINDQPALNNQQTGRVVVGRYVTAYGYYQNGIFYATSLQ